MELSNLEHFSRVDRGVYSPSQWNELDLCLRVLPAVEAHVSKQLLDRVVEAAPEEDQALTPVQCLSKIFLHDTVRNELIDCMLRQGVDLAVAQILGAILGV